MNGQIKETPKSMSATATAESTKAFELEAVLKGVLQTIEREREREEAHDIGRHDETQAEGSRHDGQAMNPLGARQGQIRPHQLSPTSCVAAVRGAREAIVADGRRDVREDLAENDGRRAEAEECEADGRRVRHDDGDVAHSGDVPEPQVEPESRKRGDAAG